MLADPKLDNPESILQTGLSSLTTDVPRSAPYETDTVAFEKQLESTKITRKGDPYPQIPPSSLKEKLAPYQKGNCFNYLELKAVFLA